MCTLLNMLIYVCRIKTQLVFSKEFPEYQVTGKKDADKKKKKKDKSYYKVMC